MAIKLTSESFLAGVRHSALVDERKLNETLQSLSSKGPPAEAHEIADELVRRNLITRWQAGKLLQGKFKGFVLGRYRLMELLGRGEMSTVYLAEHVRMKRRCAIKVLPANKVKDTSYLGRFLREAEAVAALDHPNIVRAYDVDQEHEAGTDIHFLAMEYVEGKDLEKQLGEQESFSPQDAAEFIRQAAEGLAHAHENGLIHRDIKPGNLLLDKKGIVKLLDLGLARFFRAEEEESLTIKHDEKVLGTADYLAPEQAVDSHAVDERADIYSLGCTLYFALTGYPPFTDGTLVQRLLAHQTKAPPPISRYRQDVPAGLTDILSKMLEKRKEDRYQTAREAADALARWLVHNADDTWRKGHPAVVAEVIGLDALKQASRSTQLQSSDAAAADKPVQTGKKSGTGRSRLASGSDARKKDSPPASKPASVPAPLADEPLYAPPAPIITPLTDSDLRPTPAAAASATGDGHIDWRALARRAATWQGLTVIALVLVGVFLVAGVGIQLYAVTTAPDEVNIEEVAPLESLPARSR
ncbi:MAG: serine/threonine-protein kinase [Planctomycetaceae bacterium]